MAKGKHQKFKLYRLAQIKHYRVDKMLKIQMSEEEREVTLLADNSLAGVKTSDESISYWRIKRKNRLE